MLFHKLRETCLICLLAEKLKSCLRQKLHKNKFDFEPNLIYGLVFSVTRLFD